MKKYESLNGLRAFAAIGIVIMHVRANIDVSTSNIFIYKNIISQMSDFVFLFMMVSAFSLCCGYYERFKSGSITPDVFYRRRYSRILPFFAILVLISVLIPHTPNKAAIARSSQFLGTSGFSGFTESVIEGLTELTLGYGLIPNMTLSIMGVGWFLGVIFLFYMIFPFFVFMMDNKKRAWISFVIMNMLCFFCINYFFSEKFISFNAIPRSFLYNIPFFAWGGLIYLYKDQIESFLKTKHIFALIVCVALTILYWLSFSVKDGFNGVLIISVVMGAWLMYSIGCPSKIMHNKFIDYISGISMEIYLCHMMSFRAVQYLHISNYISNVHVAYIVVSVLTLCVAIAFSHFVKYVLLARIGLLFNKNN